MGLTGFILSARLGILPIETPLVRVVKRRAKDLDGLLSLLYEEEHLSRYSVAWVDGLAQGRSLGRGVLIRGDHAPLSELPPGAAARGTLGESIGPSVPFDAPPFLLGPLSVAAFNALYYAAGRDGTGFSGLTSFFFPLDAVGAWNRLYGRRGFVQYQALLPREAAAEGCRRILEEISRERAASFLAVLKTTGAEGRGLLSFPRPGVTLALDVPNVGAHLRTPREAPRRDRPEGRGAPLPRQGLPHRRSHLRGDVPAPRRVPGGPAPARPTRTVLVGPGAPPRPSGGTVKGNVLVAGAGSTLARALAEGLADRGHGLVLAARDAAEAGRIAADLRLRFGVEAAALGFDARDAAATAALVSLAESALPGSLAGVVVAFAAMPDQEEVERDGAAGLAMIDVNVRSTMALLEAAATLLKTRPGSFLCAFSSVAGDRGRRKNYAYGATKAALSTAMEGLSARLEPAGVTVLCVKPGPSDSAMTWGLVPSSSPLLARPETVARDVLRALSRKRSVVYTPWFWRPIMAVLRALPATLFRRLPI